MANRIEVLEGLAKRELLQLMTIPEQEAFRALLVEELRYLHDAVQESRDFIKAMRNHLNR